MEPRSLQPVFSETPLSAYKVKSRTKIIRRRGQCQVRAPAPPRVLSGQGCGRQGGKALLLMGPEGPGALPVVRQHVWQE